MGLEQIRKLKEEAGLPKQKVRKQIPKKSKKRLLQEKQSRIEKSAPSAEKERWFQERRKDMTGKCSNCGKPSCKNSDEYFRFSIAHILEKAYFKSVRTHPDNWIELCFWGDNSCHSQMDNKMLDMTEMACWDEIVVKFQKMYLAIDPKEKRRIPDILLQYINTNI
jgi:hypothetical protein